MHSTASTTGLGNNLSPPSDSHLYTVSLKLVHPLSRTAAAPVACATKASSAKSSNAFACPSTLTTVPLSTAADRWFFNLHLCNVFSDPFPYPPQDCYQLVLPALIAQLRPVGFPVKCDGKPLARPLSARPSVGSAALAVSAAFALICSARLFHWLWHASLGRCRHTECKVHVPITFCMTSSSCFLLLWCPGHLIGKTSSTALSASIHVSAFPAAQVRSIAQPRSLGVDRRDALPDFHQSVFGFPCRPPYQPHKRTDGEYDH